MPEVFLKLIEIGTVWFNGFVMAGVILILVGVKNVTSKDLREYKLSHQDLSKIDEIIAWGVFYIVAGILILTGGIASIYPYLR